MRNLIIISLMILSLQAVSKSTDSVSVRVYNQGRYYIKSICLTIDSKRYTFKDIGKHKYSVYQYLPYIRTLNETDATVVRKRLFRYDEWLRLIQTPIDYIGEKEITSGKVTLIVSSRKKRKNLLLESKVIKE